MKELLAILQAITRARTALSVYEEHRPEVVLAVLRDILENDEISCALEKVQASVGSPPIVPDASPLGKEESVSLPPF
jgi:hypothetical protein